MNYIRRLYYNKMTGEMIHYHCSMSNLPLASVEHDYDSKPALAPYRDRRNDVGLFEWNEPDEAIDQAFDTMYEVRVDVSTTPPTLVFNYDFPEEPDELDLLMDQLEEVLI